MMSLKKIEVIKTMEGRHLTRWTSNNIKDTHYLVKVNDRIVWVSEEVYEIMKELASETDALTK